MGTQLNLKEAMQVGKKEDAMVWAKDIFEKEPKKTMMGVFMGIGERVSKKTGQPYKGLIFDTSEATKTFIPGFEIDWDNSEVIAEQGNPYSLTSDGRKIRIGRY